MFAVLVLQFFRRRTSRLRAPPSSPPPIQHGCRHLSSSPSQLHASGPFPCRAVDAYSHRHYAPTTSAPTVDPRRRLGPPCRRKVGGGLGVVLHQLALLPFPRDAVFLLYRLKCSFAIFPMFYKSKYAYGKNFSIF